MVTSKRSGERLAWVQELDRMRHMWLEAWAGSSDGEEAGEAGPPPKGKPHPSPTTPRFHVQQQDNQMRMGGSRF